MRSLEELEKMEEIIQNSTLSNSRINDIVGIPEALEAKTGVKLLRRVVEVSLAERVLHIRFSYPRHR